MNWAEKENTNKEESKNEDDPKKEESKKEDPLKEKVDPKDNNIEMPASPSRVWHAIHQQQAAE